MVTTSTSGNGRSSEAPRLRNFIGGEWGASAASSELPVHDPGTGALLGRVPLSSASDANAAVEAARVRIVGRIYRPILICRRLDRDGSSYMFPPRQRCTYEARLR